MINLNNFQRWCSLGTAISPYKKTLNFLLVGLIIFEFLLVLIYLGSILVSGKSYPLFDMNGQMTISSLLQALHLLIIGLIPLILLFKEWHSHIPPSNRFKLTFAILLIYGAIDEVFKIHLQLKNWIPWLGERGWLQIYIVLFIMPLIVFYSDLKFLWRSYRRETFLALLGMLIFAIGGFGAELFKDIAQPLLSLLFTQDFLMSFIEKIRIAFEEFFELIGENLIAYGFLLFLGKRLVPLRGS
ncbi:MULTISPECIES: hypothetical protein [Okeania]|uniref:Uncharacterized protein n=1 Tax=Okeania hirsuta TaxID=1458930 RepID=A0A3N6QZZ2_9CYAN|nr:MULTISPECIES: hypothetical protein [Okeania]NET18803.1 hypothetical protein [Okeania sp. SIO1H5]NET76829.1 hypothetical protein [Okeania sp. SIO1F9]NET97131.1 hypothetical protein [Okeania sp. SIO1H2]RQH23220.1 hypothetical protein D4Z78_06300 [Okeania hirsuta]RQH32870.1 hypothetical protein D5R40_21910 [Okeania hirsuta]